MHFQQWLDSVRQRLQSGSRGASTRRRPERRDNVPSESLEQRALLSVSTLLVGGELSIYMDGADEVIVRADPSDPDPTNGAPLQVIENGIAATTVGGANVNQVKSIRVRGGGLANLIDLSAVRANVFTGLTNGIRVDGGDGADTILGSADLNDSISGSDGDDSIVGGSGANTLDGGDGNDSIDGGDGLDVIDAGDGHDLVIAGLGNDTVRGGDGDDTLSGDDGDDSINAGNGEDLVNGNGGNDTLFGEFGADTVNGDAGDDSINGGGGKDSLSGGDGNDNVFGVGLADTILGDAGNDTLDGGGGNDSIDGGDGTDAIDAGAANDTVTGGNGSDIIYGGAGTDSLSGGEDNDTIYGNGGSDSLYGNNGQDELHGGAGNDLVDATDDAATPVTPTPQARLFATALDGSNSIVELDPVTGLELRRIAAPEAFGTGGDGLAFDGVHLFYMNGFGNDLLYEIDPNTGIVIDADPLTIGSRNYEGIAVLGGLVYVLDYTAGDIDVFDPATDTIVRTIDVNGLNPTVSLLIGGMAGIANPDRLVIVEAGGSRVHLLDPTTGLITNTFVPGTAAAGSYYGAGVVNGEIYLGSGTSNVLDVFSRTGMLQRSFTPPYPISAIGADDIGTSSTPAGGGTVSTFDIDLVFDSSVSASQRATFRAAADRWEQVIAGDIPDVIVPGVGNVDDLSISITAQPIDLAGNVLAETELIAARVGSFLPSATDIRFDSADLSALDASGQLQEVALHEIAHALGFGLIWDDLGLIVGAGTSDPRFVGTNAVAEYNARFGLNSTTVPVENVGGPGSVDLHWRESLLTNELMTSVLNSGSNPLTRLTIGQFEDLGYQVDYGAADAASFSNSSISALNIRTTARQRGANGQPLGQFIPIGAGGSSNTNNSDVISSFVASPAASQVKGYTRIINSNPLLVVPGLDVSKANRVSGMTLSDLRANQVLQNQNARLQVPETEPNNSLPSAANIDGYGFSVTLDPNITDAANVNTSASLPHVSIQGTGNGTFDVFSFTVTNAGDRGIFDIDFSSGMDGLLTLSDSAGNVLRTADDLLSGLDPGSTATIDPLLDYTFASAGTYFITVADFGGRAATSNPVPAGALYTLHVSIENHAIGSATGGGATPTIAVFGDTLFGDDGDDTLIGSPADDQLTGNSGNDSIVGDDGNDTIYGGTGADSIDAGNGNDSIRGNTGADTINNGSGDDFILWRIGDGNDFVQDAPGLDNFTVEGTPGANVFNFGQNLGQLLINVEQALITVESGSTVINVNGLGGNDTYNVADLDTISGLSLNLNGGLGRDTYNLSGSNTGSVRITLDGGEGGDTINGSLNDETLIGGDGNDVINGGGGNDLIQGLAGDDTLSGGDGDDTLDGGTGIDSLLGGVGDDSLIGGTNNDVLNGEDGNDELSGDSGDDTLLGGLGDDSLLGVAGNDSLVGGAGADFLNGGTEDDIILGQAGNDTIRGGDGEDSIYGGLGDDVINAGDGDDFVTGQSGNDSITGSDGNDTIRGDAGSDLIVGGDGDDALLGNADNDTVLGGDGNDFIRAHGGSDVIAGGEGTNLFGTPGVDYAVSEINELFELSNELKLLLQALPKS